MLAKLANTLDPLQVNLIVIPDPMSDLREGNLKGREVEGLVADTRSNLLIIAGHCAESIVCLMRDCELKFINFDGVWSN